MILTRKLNRSGDFSFAAQSKVLLVGGITSDRVYYVGATKVLLGPQAQVSGTILTQTNVVVGDGAQIQGRVYSLTEVAFAQGSIVNPPMTYNSTCKSFNPAQ